MKASPQNNPLRTYVTFFESGINLFYPSKTPNEISFLGLNKVKLAVKLGYKKGFLNKSRAAASYIIGVSLDVLDGVRARKNPMLVTVDGQLIDGYCDRMREVIPLKKRAELRLSTSPSAALLTYLTVLSCLLPSIARAQAESTGIIVPEKDIQGGSSFNRALSLTESFIQDILGFRKMSIKNDEKIYYSNMATYHNRKGKTSSFYWNMKYPQAKAFERLLLYTEILQKEYEEIFKQLKGSSNLQKKYQEKARNFMKEFLDIDIKKLRRIKGFKNFSLKD